MRRGTLWTLALLFAAAPASGQSGKPALGAPPAFDLEALPDEHVRLEAETPIRPRPDPRSPALTRLDATAELPVVERRAGWVKVRYGSLTGWVALVAEPPVPIVSTPGASAHGDFEAGMRRLFGGPDPEDLERARRHLGEGAVESTLGPYRLFTDVTDPVLLADLGRLAESLPGVFRERFGVAAEAGAEEAVVLYADGQSYFDYVAGEDDATLLDSSGRAVTGLAVLAAGGRTPAQVASILVHELAHLLTYRGFPGRELPIWLSEGLAEELSSSRVREGVLLPGTLASWESTRSVPVVDRRGRLHLATEHWTVGPRVALEELRERWRDPERTPLDVLLTLPRQLFMESGKRSLHYAMSAFFVRYLLAEHGDGLRAFLEAASTGGPVDAGALRQHLVGGPAVDGWHALERAWGRWLRGRGPLRGSR